MEDNIVGINSASAEDAATPSPLELIAGYMQNATQHLNQIAEMAIRLEQMVTKDGQLNRSVADATRAARQRAQESYFWIMQASTIVSSIVEGIEEQENNDGN